MTSQQLVDGIVPDRVERPSTADEIGKLLQSFDPGHAWVLPLGGGTAMSGANPVDRIPVALDLTGLEGVTEYEPADLTVSVDAGTRWHVLQEVLREQGQTIPLDVPFPDQATVGGVMATAYAGPRRMRDGSLKDLLLGATYVRGDGLVAKAGGKVVKNVSGFEITRLLHGSWGSLAVITSVNLKTIPMHEFDLTLQSEPSDAVSTVEQVLALTRERSAVAAAVIDGSMDSGTVSVRLTGRQGPTGDLAREIRETSGIAWATEIEQSSDWWQQREDRLATDTPGRVCMEIGCQPVDVPSVVRALQVGLPGASGLDLHVSPGSGAIHLVFDAAAISLSAWQRIWAEHGLDRTARWAIASAPREWREERDVWAIQPGPLKIMRSLKDVFDPSDTLNRGRLWTAPLATKT